MEWSTGPEGPGRLQRRRRVVELLVAAFVGCEDLEEPRGSRGGRRRPLQTVPEPGPPGAWGRLGAVLWGRGCPPTFVDLGSTRGRAGSLWGRLAMAAALERTAMVGGIKFPIPCPGIARRAPRRVARLGHPPKLPKRCFNFVPDAELRLKFGSFSPSLGNQIIGRTRPDSTQELDEGGQLRCPPAGVQKPFARGTLVHRQARALRRGDHRRAARALQTR